MTRPWDVSTELGEIAATIDELRAYASLPTHHAFGQPVHDAAAEIVRINAALKRIANRARSMQ